MPTTSYNNASAITLTNTFNDWRTCTNNLVLDAIQIQSGVITFVNNKTFADGTFTIADSVSSVVLGISPSMKTSLTTPSSTFSLINTTATTVNAFGAATTLSMGSSTGTTSINNALSVGSGGTKFVVTRDTGKVTSGIWEATIISPTYGGTGINNGSYTITIGGNVVTVGTFSSGGNFSTGSTFSTTGTFSSGGNFSTGSTFSIAGAFTKSGNHATTLTTTGTTNLTLPTSGTLATLSDITYVGTTAISLSRASAAQSLTGINGLTAASNSDLTLTPGTDKAVFIPTDIAFTTKDVDGYYLDGTVLFKVYNSNGVGGTNLATLDSNGTLRINGDLRISGKAVIPAGSLSIGWNYITDKSYFSVIKAGSSGGVGGTSVNPTSNAATTLYLESGSAALTISGTDGVTKTVTLGLDADLTAIAALSSTGYPKRTGSNTWSISDAVSGTTVTASTGYYAGAQQIVNSSGQWVGDPTGLQGIQGTQGAQGLQGRQGIQGTLGQTGVQGVQGTQGASGYQGINGSQGIQGTQGAQGIQGIAGAAASQGVQGIQGTQGTLGTQGTQGIQGRQGITGSQGAQGIQGTQGAQGIQGTQGAQGTVGTQGTQGIQGYTGSKGDQGNQGIQGYTGSKGDQGIQGIQGYIGPQGTSGALYTDQNLFTSSSPQFAAVTAGSFNATSSIAYKTNVSPLDDALAIIQNINGVIYDRKDGRKFNEIGVIAEDVSKVVPSVVGFKDGKPDSVDYSRFTPILIEAIKELVARIQKLENK